MRRPSRDQIGFDGCSMSMSCSIVSGVSGETARGGAARGTTVAALKAARNASGIVNTGRIGRPPSEAPTLYQAGRYAISGRQGRREDAAVRAARDDPDAPAVRFGHPPPHAEAKPRPPRAPGRIHPAERLAYAHALFHRHAW